MNDDDFYGMELEKKGAREIYSDRNQIVIRLKRLGLQHGLRMQVFFLPAPLNYYVIMATNGSGLRFHFAEARNLDARILDEARFTFYVNKNAKKYFRSLREKERYKRIRDFTSFQDTNRGVARENKRLFQRLSRALGVTPGKTNIPY